MKEKFLKPEDIEITDKKATVSARLSEASRDYLYKEAEKAGISISRLISEALEGYVAWLKNQRKK